MRLENRVRVVVSTNPDRGHWLNDLLASIPSYPSWQVDVIITRHFEMEAIRQGFLAGYPRFLFLQDSVVIKDPSGFMAVVDPFVTASLMARPSCYMFVYDRRVLERLTFPPKIEPEDKETSILYETQFTDAYQEKALEMGLGINGQFPVIFPELTDARALADNSFEVVHNEKRLVLENGFMKKRKGTYRP